MPIVTQPPFTEQPAIYLLTRLWRQYIPWPALVRDRNARAKSKE